jgi:hypothetical protein
MPRSRKSRGLPIEAVTPGQEEVRFPGYDVLAESSTWDELTLSVVVSRLGPRGPLRYFTETQEPTVRALCDRILKQDDEPKVPAVEMIDERLLQRRGDGYRYCDMPEDWEAWSRSVDGIEEDARAETGQPFSDLPIASQLELIEKVRLTKGQWHGMPAGHLFELWTRYCCEAFYSHPWAWNEIGFGGPAYPRGYKNLGVGKREPWEVEEHDADDPIPWAERTERARKDHVSEPEDTLGTDLS